MDLLNVLNLEIMNLNLKATNKKQAIQELSQLLFQNGRVQNSDEFVQDVYKREEIGPTGMGNEIAIPHGLSEEVTKASVAIGKVSSPIEWESLDDQPVKLIFLIAVPSVNQGISHLKILSQLASILAYQEILDELMLCKDERHFLETLSKHYQQRLVTVE